MATILADRLVGNSWRQTLEDGWTIERIMIVTGVGGTATNKVITAIATEGFPQVGDAHPDLATCILRSIDAEAVTGDQVRFRLTYSQKISNYTEDATVVEVGATVSQLETNKDINDNDFSVSYTYPAVYKRNTAMQSVEDTTGGFVTKFVPERIITLTRRESSSPESLANTYVGKMNTYSWRSGAAKTWLCTGIIGRSNDGGDNYDVTYTFQYRADTWDARVVYIDPNTGKPPDDLVENTGKKTYVIYETADFDNLDLD